MILSPDEISLDTLPATKNAKEVGKYTEALAVRLWKSSWHEFRWAVFVMFTISDSQNLPVRLDNLTDLMVTIVLILKTTSSVKAKFIFKFYEHKPDYS